MNYQTTTLRRALAADYAIGLMPPTARRRFDALLLDDAALRVELGHWQDALASLTGTLPERPVPDHVWAGIKARIEPQVLHVPATKPFWMNFRLLAAACAVVVAVLVGVLYQREMAPSTTPHWWPPTSNRRCRSGRLAITCKSSR